ncbi:hypothetical protein Tco_0778366 [Tanacetum coccineum]
MVINSPWEQTLAESQELTNPELMATGKDTLNPLICFNDLLLLGVNTPGCDENNLNKKLKPKELEVKQVKFKLGEDCWEICKLDKEETDDQDEEYISQYIVLVDVEEIALNAIPLATKPPMIVDVEVVSKRHMSSYYIIRADGNSRRYSTLTHIFQDIDMEDLENLWKIVKGKFKDAGSEDNYKRVLWGDLNVMFELDLESEIWNMIGHYDVEAWVLYSSCGVHLIKFEGLYIFLLVDKVYPLPYATITKMLDRKLQGEQNEMAYQLIKIILKLQQQKK